MKNKNQKSKILEERLLKYSRQMGILDLEIPKLTFDGAEFRELNNQPKARHGYESSRLGGKYTTCRGICSYFNRVIFVKINGRNETIKELTHTLVHELVHYRFNYLSHGRQFEDRINKILKGKTYPRKHITVPQLPYI